MNSGMEIHGLDEFTAQLEEVKKKYPDAAITELQHLGSMLKKKAIEKSPEGKSKDKYKLKKSYHLSQPKQINGTVFLEFRSSSPHFHLIERGHKMVGKGGKELGFIPGVFMVKHSVDEMEKEIPAELEAWLDKLTKELR
jgi:hypothetical protein